MFGNKSKQNQKTNNTESATTPSGNGQGLTCIIASGTRIEGKFTTTEDVRLDGTIVGEVICKKRVVKAKLEK